MDTLRLISQLTAYIYKYNYDDNIFIIFTAMILIFGYSKIIFMI
jgi:hypothetical protein